MTQKKSISKPRIRKAKIAKVVPLGPDKHLVIADHVEFEVDEIPQEPIPEEVIDLEKEAPKSSWRTFFTSFFK